MSKPHESRQLLRPAFVVHLLAQLPDKEAEQLLLYADAADTPEDFVARTSEWLRKRFNLDRHTAG